MKHNDPQLVLFQAANPLGVVSVLTAFNFPVAVYGWNFALSLAAGNATIWKPSETTPLCAVAVTKIITQVLEKNGVPGAVSALVTGDKYTGEAITESRDVDLGQYLYALPWNSNLKLDSSLVHR